MSNFKLAPQSPLDGVEYTMGEISVTKVSNLALVSVAIPNGERDAVSKALLDNYQMDIPEVRKSTVSKNSKARFLGLQSDQFFALFEYSGDQAVEHLASKINDVAYLADQSDSWVMLRISSESVERCREALERICPIDLHPESFGEGSVARTAMEHLAVIILHEREGQYLLMSPRSSAKSFLHAITTSIENIS